MEEVFFCPNCMAKISAGDTKCPVCGGNVNVQNAAHQLPVNTILNGRYIIGKVLGEGGFGITYLGYDLQTDTKAAIKEYFPSGISYRFSGQSRTVSIQDKGSSEQFAKGKERFLGEARTVYRFRDEENIVNVLDFFSENNTVYIVMEYIEGVSLGQYLSQNGRVGDFDELYKILRPVMVSLDHVHKAGLIHRDISPSNLMIDMNGTVKLLDFGTARSMSEDGEKSLSVVLKHGFAPMEQYKTHGKQGAWTDVYALCATMYKLLTGQTPVSAMDRMDSEMPLPSALGVKISPAQEEVLFKGLALPVKDRIQTVGELIALFDAAAKPAEAEKKQPVNSAAALKEKRQTENAAAKKAPNKKAIYIIAAILALAVCISFFIFASPNKIIARGSCGGSAGWSLTEDGTLTISGTGATENYSDKSAQGWYGHADAINSVIISDGITHIGNRAFSGCSALTEITIPDSVTNIGSSAFYGCTALAEIALPDSVTSIDDFAFYGCYNLSDVYYSGSESDWSKIKIYDSNNCLTNAKIHFNSAMPSQGAQSAAPLPTPPSAAIIASGSCGGSAEWSLTEDGTLTISGTGAMEDYSYAAQSWYEHAGAINNVIISDGITHIGSWAFADCSALTEITIPDSVTSIEWGAFSGCSSLTEITIPDSVISIGDSAFRGCSSLTEITIPSSVTSIEWGAFSGCSALSEIMIPDSVISIGECAFEDCSSLTETMIPNSVTRIASYAFSGCSALSEIAIPDSVISIGEGAFRGCSSLTEITIPNSVTSIEWGAFDGCDILSDVYYGGSQSDWSKIETYGYYNCLTDAKIHYNSAMPET